MAQFKGLKPRLEGYVRRVEKKLAQPGVEVVNLGLIDNPKAAMQAGHDFRAADVDIIFLHVTTYALSSTVLPVVQRAKVPVILVILLGGLTTNFIWCVLLHITNGSAHQYFSSTVKPVAGHTQGGSGHGEKISGEVFEVGSAVPLFGNYLFCILAGTLWYLQFFFYQMGESQMGAYKFSSWTLHMASIIIVSTLWGIFFKEWKGAQPFTKKLVMLMLMFLVGSTIIIGLGNKKSADTEAAAKAKLEMVVPAVQPTAAEAAK